MTKRSFIALVMCLIFFLGIASAEPIVTVNLNDDPAEISPGDLITFRIGYSSGEPGIFCEDAFFTYDHACLEYLSSSGSYMFVNADGTYYGGLDDAGGIEIKMRVKQDVSCGAIIQTSAKVVSIEIDPPNNEGNDSEETMVVCQQIPEYSCLLIPIVIVLGIFMVAKIFRMK